MERQTAANGNRLSGISEGREVKGWYGELEWEEVKNRCKEQGSRCMGKTKIKEGAQGVRRTGKAKRLFN